MIWRVIDFVTTLSKWTFGLCLLGGVVALGIKKLRPIWAAATITCSMLWMFDVWICSASIVYMIWGGVGLILGLLSGGVGVIPFALVATALHGIWDQFTSILVGAIVALVFRKLAVNSLSEELHSETSSPAFEPRTLSGKYGQRGTKNMGIASKPHTTGEDISRLLSFTQVELDAPKSDDGEPIL